MLLLGVVGALVWTLGGRDGGTNDDRETAAQTPPAQGPVVYRVIGNADATITYSTGDALGSVSRSVRLPWRVTVPPGARGSVYTVSATGGSGECSISRDGRELDRRTAAPGRPLVCSAAG